MTKKVLAFILATGLTLIGLHAFPDETQRWCPLCGMNLKMFWKTHVRLTLSDGSQKGYCSLHCAATAYRRQPARIVKWEIVDYDTGKLIDGSKAHFLVGSSLPGTMTAISKLAFRSLETAGTYQKAHGGQIVGFDEALARAVADLGTDNAAIKKKMAKAADMGRKLASEFGCFTCHGDDGGGGKAVGWSSDGFTRKMTDRIKIKEQILKGSTGMEGLEGRISEKDLHQVTLFVWTRRTQ